MADLGCGVAMRSNGNPCPRIDEFTTTTIAVVKVQKVRIQKMPKNLRISEEALVKLHILTRRVNAPCDNSRKSTQGGSRHVEIRSLRGSRRRSCERHRSSPLATMSGHEDASRRVARAGVAELLHGPTGGFTIPALLRDHHQLVSTQRPGEMLRIPMSLVLILTSFSCQAGVILDTSYTAAEGYANAPLTNNVNWAGGAQVAVRPGTTGFVTNGAIRTSAPTYFRTGMLEPGDTFRVGDQISISTQVQFTVVGGGFAQELARFGFSGQLFTSGSPTPLEQGFGVVWDKGRNQDSTDSGTVRFFPDFNDYILFDDILFTNAFNSFSILGKYVGLDVANGDFRSNPFEIQYTAEKVGTTQWDVVSLLIQDKVTMANFYYDLNVQPLQSFDFSRSNAFFGQRINVVGLNGNANVVTSEFVTVSFNHPVPEPSTVWLALMGITMFVPREFKRARELFKRRPHISTP